MKKILIIVLVATFFISLPPCIAEDEDAVVRYEFVFNNDLFDDENTFIEHNMGFLLKDKLHFDNCVFDTNMIPYAQIRQNLHNHQIERVAVGVELGLHMFSWLYLAERFQQIWRDEALYTPDQLNAEEMAEAITHLFFTIPMFNLGKRSVEAYFSEDHTYDFRDKRATRNEIAAGLRVPLGKRFTISLGWRHIDRIHFYDSDTIECRARYSF